MASPSSIWTVVHCNTCPISSNGPPLRYSDTDNDFDMALVSGQATGQTVGFGDITADGLSDLWLADPVADIQCLTGLGIP